MESKKKRNGPRRPPIEEEVGHTFPVTYSCPPSILTWLDFFRKKHPDQFGSRASLTTAAIVFFKKAKEKEDGRRGQA